MSVLKFPKIRLPRVAGFGNTPLNSEKCDRPSGFAAGVDYTTFIFTASFDLFQAAVEFSADMFDDVWEMKPGVPINRGQLFQNHAVSARGGIIGWNVLDDGRYRAWFDFPAGVVRACTLVELQCYMLSMKEMIPELHFTRFDSALDDYEKRLNPNLIIEACEHDVHNYALFEKFDPRIPTCPGQYLGFTLYMGSQNSEKLTRYYDKDVESKGRIAAYRLEVQYRRHSAQAVAGEFINMPSDPDLMSAYLASLAVGSVDFISRWNSKGNFRKNLDECPKLSWWQEFVDAVGVQIRASVVRPKPTLIKTLDWSKRSWVRALATFRALMGQDGLFAYVNALADEGEEKLTAFHRQIIEREKIKFMKLPKIGFRYDGELIMEYFDDASVNSLVNA